MDKVVFVTGGSRGIGLSTVKKFADKGWRVAAFYNSKKGPDIKNVNWYQIELQDFESIRTSFDKAFTDLRRIDCLINNAGVFGMKNLQAYDLELMNKVIDTNEKGTYLCTKIALEKMTEGTIVNISSTTALVGSTDPIYAASKAAVIGFTKAMAKALAPKIRVNAVAPSATNTDMMKTYNPERVMQLIDQTLLKRMAEPEDIADAIYFLSTEESRHITGICLNLSGGYVLT
jgi:3-oxoacyl-[acyl-carrier protein] reductase